jgi:hypothetical protein
MERERRELSGDIGTAEGDLWTHFRQKQVTGLHWASTHFSWQFWSETSARSLLCSEQNGGTEGYTFLSAVFHDALPLMPKTHFHSHTELQVKLYVVLPDVWNLSCGWYIEQKAAHCNMYVCLWSVCVPDCTWLPAHSLLHLNQKVKNFSHGSHIVIVHSTKQLPQESCVLFEDILPQTILSDASSSEICVFAILPLRNVGMKTDSKVELRGDTLKIWCSLKPSFLRNGGK